MLSLAIAPTVEPVTLEEVKLHLRVGGTAEDNRLTDLAIGARQWVERQTDLALLTQSWDWTFATWPSDLYRLEAGLRLPIRPVSAVTSITYLDQSLVTQTLATTVYLLQAPSGADPAAGPASIALKFGQVLPPALVQAGAITIRFVAGFGATAATVPADLRLAILQRCAMVYDGVTDQATVRATLAPYVGLGIA